MTPVTDVPCGPSSSRSAFVADHVAAFDAAYAVAIGVHADRDSTLAIAPQIQRHLDAGGGLSVVAHNNASAATDPVSEPAYGDRANNSLPDKF
jgi:hypothetical protein